MKKRFIILVFAFCSAMFFAQSKKNAQVTNLYKNYISLKNALATDSSAKASISATDFLKTVSVINSKIIAEGNLAIMKNSAKVIANSDNIKVQRKNFENISNQMIALAKLFKLTDNSVYIQYCPMADAGWLSNESKIINPYYGSSMLSCGKVQQEIK